MKFVRTIGMASAVLCLIAGVAEAAEDHIWARLGATDAGMEADLAACHKEAQTVPVHIQQATYVTTTTGGAIAGALTMAIIAGVKKSHAENNYDRHCMRRHGYVWLPLSAEEEKSLGKQKTPSDRGAWIDALYESNLAQRLDAAWKPPVPQLPVAVEEPFTYGAVRVDPAAFTVASGQIGKGEVLLSGKASHRRTARLKRATETSILGFQRIEAGMVLFEAVYPSDFEPAQTYWCGVFSVKPLMGPHTAAMCVMTTETGYQLLPAAGEPWMVGPPILDPPSNNKTASADFSLEESQDDLLGDMDLKFTVRWLNDTGVVIEAKALKNGRSVLVWSGDLAFDKDCKAVLPFWSHRLTITRKDKKVTAAFTPDGDGAGWDEAKLVG